MSRKVTEVQVRQTERDRGTPASESAGASTNQLQSAVHLRDGKAGHVKEGSFAFCLLALTPASKSILPVAMESLDGH